MRPTFSGFYVAKRGLDAARANLQVTGQNMTNANSIGYTRQRVDLYAVGATGFNSRYSLKTDAYIGEGVSIGGISQIRDPYLDVHYRHENSKYGNVLTQLESLTDLENIFDEIEKEGMDKQFSDILSQLQNLSENPSDPVAEKIVQTSCLMLVKMFNHMSDQINVVKDRQLGYLKDSAITKANDLIDNIAYINKQIKNAHISGNPALELLDQRNLMIDELSSFADIEVSTKLVDIGCGVKVEELSIDFVAPGGQKFNLVDNDKHRKFDMNVGSDGKVSIKLLESDGTNVNISNSGEQTLVDADITNLLTSGSFSGYLKMLNAQGEFEGTTTDRGIGYYDNMLNTLASEFADLFNKANSMNDTPPYDKPMFESKDGGKITAGNIQLSEKWTSSTGSYITASKKPPVPGVDSSKSNDNILHMISLFNSDIEFKAEATGIPLFKGSLQKCFSHISSTLALEMKSTQRQFDSYEGTLTEITKQKASISTVNIDEEGINLIMYNQALTASSRYMTTLDEATDTIINRMGVVGR